jgi:leucyl/phenylalanyl-tRNA--protein transferase
LGRTPIEPEASAWNFSLDRAVPGDDLIAVGADLAPGTLLAAYRTGLFPMGTGPAGEPPMGWWSPDPRGVLLPGRLHVSRSLRSSLRRYRTTVDRAFSEVVEGCADPSRPGRWITPEIIEAYSQLHELGWAHSIETWAGDRLVGGLYGVGIGGLFAGESMFRRTRDASKVALAGLVERFFDGDPRRLIDVQWRTDHLATLGVIDVPRAIYLRRLAEVVDAPAPDLSRGSVAPS